jgi:predicted amidophosphoribosyltransferase
VEELLRGGVCRGCWSALPLPEDPRCRRCAESLPGSLPGALCGRCRLDPPAFERLEAAAPYLGAARHVLLAFKFEGADFLGRRIADVMAERLEPPEADEVAAVPATPRARRTRGYHPAAVLGAAVARRLGRPFAPDRLRKVRDTEIQSRVRAAERAGNVRRAFAVSGAPPERILLVDDVATSGATARECAERLVRAGARRVVVWCFARASRADIETETA